MRGCSVLQWLAMLVLFAGGCGGGGGGSDLVSTPNSPPVALAGVDHEVNVGLPVTLDGRGSRDSEGDAMTYTWTLTGKPAGSQATLSSSISPANVRAAAVSSNGTFRATLLPDEPGTYEVTLVVDDGQSFSEPSKIILTAVPTFAATYGGEAYDAITSVQETSDGGFILLGISNSYGSTDPFFENHVTLIKTDRFGREIWSKALPKEMSEASDIIEIFDGGFIVGGAKRRSYGNYVDLCVLRTDAVGNLKWMKIWETASTNRLHSFSKTADGNYLLISNSIDFLTSVESGVLLKIDVDGNEVWSHSFVYGIPWGSMVVATQDGGFVIADSVIYQDTGSDIRLAKFDANGDPLWFKLLGGTNDEYVDNIFEASDQGLIVIGTSNDSVNRYGLVMKTDYEGSEIWSNTIDRRVVEQAMIVVENPDGGFVVAGRVFNAYPPYDWAGTRIGLLRIDEMGNEISHNSLALLYENTAFNIIRTFNGSYLLSGSCSEKGQVIANMLLIKTDPNGNVNPMATPIPDVAFPPGVSVSVDLSQYFSDPNGDPLSYKIAGLPGGLGYDEATGRITGTIPAAGSSINYPLAVTVTDPEGLIASQTMILQVTVH